MEGRRGDFVYFYGGDRHLGGLAINLFHSLYLTLSSFTGVVVCLQDCMTRLPCFPFFPFHLNTTIEVQLNNSMCLL